MHRAQHLGEGAQRVAFASRALHRIVTGRHPALRDALVGLLPG
ncbi:hypothetical protein [Streptomyces sp. NPDC058279]